MQGKKQLLNSTLAKGKGVFRLFPTWVPRSFCIPGRRLKLHPDDYYAFGVHRGGIDERWFASTTKADNGPLTLADEGLSYIFTGEGGADSKILLKDAIELLGAEIIGDDLMKRYHGWPMYSKFFDNLEPLPLHLHLNDACAAKVSRKGKPEGYYFPLQLNNHPALFPHTYFGLNPGTTKDEVKKCLEQWHARDNGILGLSKAYLLRPGTGWDVPPGVLHAPGSLLTYEPQFASDVFSMFQNLTWNKFIPRDLLVKDVPEARRADLDYIVDMVDWDLNLDPDFYAHRFLAPKPVKPIDEMHECGYAEQRIVYGSDYFSAKELTVRPKRSVVIQENGAYGAIVIQGHGKFGVLDVESPAMIRFGAMTSDEVFVTANAALDGVEIVNESATDDLVMLKHFAQG
nr:hypothetical protein [Candidatus Sigynarchaeum springense]